MGNEAIKAIGAACQVSSSRPLQAIGAFPKKFWSRMVGRHSHTPSVSNPPRAARKRPRAGRGGGVPGKRRQPIH